MVEDVDISVDVWMLESVGDGVDIGVVVVNTGLEYLDDDVVVGSCWHVGGSPPMFRHDRSNLNFQRVSNPDDS